jgi:D-proline reductase (dithiol) PrdB
LSTAACRGFSSATSRSATARPFDVESQALTLELALRVLESAPAARTTVQSPLRWRDDASWKLDFSNLDRMTPEQIAERRREFDAIKAIAKSKRDAVEPR